MNGQYYASTLVQFFHGFPHLTFKFLLLDDPKFDVNNNSYLESLVMIALMPVVFLVITMICFFVYYCFVKMKQPPLSKANKSACYCSVCLMVIFVMMALGCLSVAVYGTVQIHEGAEQATRAAEKINQTYNNIVDEIRTAKTLTYHLHAIVMNANLPFINNTDGNDFLSDVNSLSSFVDNIPIKSKQEKSQFALLLESLRTIENYRTIVTFSVIGFQSLICVFALLGICFRSRALLMTAVFTGLLCLVLSYVYTGVALTSEVAATDFCMDPYYYMKQLIREQLNVDNATAQYYITCSRQDNFTFQDLVLNATATALSARYYIIHEDKAFETVEDTLMNEVYNTTDKLYVNLYGLSTYTDCAAVRLPTKEFALSVCFSVVDGLFILLVAIFSVCLALTAVFCAAPFSWKRFSKVKATEELDLDDVFLPAPARHHSVSRTNNPLYISPDDLASNHSSSATPTAPAATNTLSFFRQSEENLSLLDQSPPEYFPPSP